MKKIQIIGAIGIIALASALMIFLQRGKVAPAKIRNNTPQNISDNTSPQGTNSPPSQNSENIQVPNPFLPPFDRASERVTKKPFGIFITPKNSPVQPERFRGYHTGTDFEIFPEETSADVSVSAICAGTIAQKKTVSGYGGVFVENCTLDNQPITVVYGHLKLASISKSVGDDITQGEIIGILGKAYSSETDGERKHLHLGIHKGKTVNIRGYVATQVELSDWFDPCNYVCR